MPRTPTVPRYGKHKASGQARVILNGQHHYLGPYDSPTSRQRYAKLIAEYLQGDGQPAPEVGSQSGAGLLVAELIVAYLRFAKSYYVKAGSPTGEADNIKYAMRPLRQLYGDSPAVDFGPKSLKVLQEHMASGQSLARPTVNKRINTIRRMFKWGVSEELVPAAVYEALRSVDGLRRGRTNARETPPVVPVDDNDVEKTLVYLPPTVAAMVRVQRLSGMRPGSVTLMRSCDIDRSGGVWIYEPHDHKTKYRDHRLLIPIGPEAQAVLQPFLNRPGNAYLFAPSEAQAWRREQRAARPSTRKSPVYPSERKRVERDKQRRCRRKSKRMPGPRYTTATYYRAVRYGIRAARKAGDDVADWHPNQLRHTRATEVRRDHGVEAAQVVLGHRNAHVTQVYAERDMALACQVAKRSG